MSQFIYQNSYGFEWIILFILVILLFKPRYFVSLVAAINFLRPDERFPLSIPIIYLANLLLIICIMINIRKLITKHYDIGEWALFLFGGLIISETIMFDRANIVSNIQYIFLGFAYYLALQIFVEDEKSYLTLCRTLIVSSALICGEPLFYLLTLSAENPVLQKFLGHEGRIQAWGMWRNANETSFIALLGVVCILIIISRGKSYGVFKTLYYGPFLILFLVVTVMTVSRTGIACLALMACSTVIMTKKVVIKAGAIGLIIAILILAPVYLATRTDMEGSASERSDLRYIGKHIYLDHPIFGVGLWNSRYGYGTRGQPLHNTFLQAFAETGTLGGLLLLFYVGKNGEKLIIRFMRARMERGFMGIMIGFYLSANLYFLFGNQLLSVMFMTAYGVIRAGLKLGECDMNSNNPIVAS